MVKLSQKLEWGALRETVSQVSYHFLSVQKIEEVFCRVHSISYAECFVSIVGLGCELARDIRGANAR